MAFAITWREAIACEGAAARFAVPACGPSTASRTGGTAALESTGARENCCWFTATALRDTGCALANARCGIAVTPPRTLRFTYVTLFIVVLFLTMVVL